MVETNESIVICKQVLLHDAPEAYLNDIPGPWKHLLPDYQALEERLLKHIFNCYNVPYPLEPVVKWVDKQICLDEMLSLTEWPEGKYGGVVDHVEPWHNEYARDTYLNLLNTVL
jgi:hypothetical protein